MQAFALSERHKRNNVKVTRLHNVGVNGDCVTLQDMYSVKPLPCGRLLQLS